MKLNLLFMNLIKYKFILLLFLSTILAGIFQAKADVGFAMGNGTDIAIESADITLTSGELKNINNSIILSKKIILNIKQTLLKICTLMTTTVSIAISFFLPYKNILF